MYTGNIQTKPNQPAERRNKTYNREEELVSIKDTQKFKNLKDACGINNLTLTNQSFMLCF